MRNVTREEAKLYLQQAADELFDGAYAPRLKQFMDWRLKTAIPSSQTICDRLGYEHTLEGWAALCADLLGLPLPKERHRAELDPDRARELLLASAQDLYSGDWIPTRGQYDKWRNPETDPSGLGMLMALGYERRGNIAAEWEKMAADLTDLEVFPARVPNPHKEFKTNKPERPEKEPPEDDIEIVDQSWYTDRAFLVSSQRTIGSRTYYMLR
jgi:hypothetical protein